MKTWQERLQDMEKNGHKDIDKLFERHSTAHNLDMGFAGTNGGSMFIRETGVIDIFSKEGLGIAIDPATDSITLYASKINLNGKTLDVNCDTYGFRVNKWPLNLANQLTGTAGPFPAVIFPGTIMPYYTAPQDIAMFTAKMAGSLLGVG